MSRLNILPDPRLEPFQAGLEARLLQLAGLINGENFAEFLTPLAEGVLLDAFERVGADEGTVWLIDKPNEVLVPSYNSKPNSEELLRYRQPIRKGLISMVFANEQPFIMNHAPPEMDTTLQQILKVQVRAMIAVPLYFLGHCRGVVSCVQFHRETDEQELPSASRAKSAEPGQQFHHHGDEHRQPGFEAEAVKPIKRAAEVLRVTIDAACLSKTVGINL